MPLAWGRSVAGVHLVVLGALLPLTTGCPEICAALADAGIDICNLNANGNDNTNDNGNSNDNSNDNGNANDNDNSNDNDNDNDNGNGNDILDARRRSASVAAPTIGGRR